MTLKKKYLIISIIFALFWIITSIITYYNTSFIYEIGLVEQSIWNTINGDFFYSVSNGGNHFARHNSPILFLFLPLYKLFPHIIIFSLINNMFIALGSVAVYRFAKNKLNSDFASIIFLFSYLLFPCFYYSNLRSFHPIMLSVPFIAFGLYYLIINNWKPAIFFLILALSTNETVSLIIIFLGLFYFFQNKKRGLMICLIGLIWFYFSIMIVIPHFNINQEYPYFKELYGYLGASPKDIISNVANPMYLIKTNIIKQKILYLQNIFQHNLFLSFLSPTILLITIPIFIQNLLSISAYKYDILAHYIYPAIPIIIFSAIMGLKKIQKVLKIKHFKLILIFLLAMAIFNMFTIGLVPFFKDNCKIFNGLNKEYCQPTNDIIGNSPKETKYLLKSIITLIPDNSSVMAQNHIFSQVSNRKETYLFSQFYQIPSADYIILDEKGIVEPVSDLQLYKQKLHEYNYDLIAQKDYVYLFKKMSVYI
ncbi:MAG: DUF2079 domain-containing protein [Nanoarchaeota archaeon]